MAERMKMGAMQVMELSDIDRSVLIRATERSQRKTGRAFIVETDSDDHHVCHALAERGLMKKMERHWPRGHWFVVTDSGRAALSALKAKE